ncbi:hypothetical protein BDW74DRAFT_112558 [Aspergillus multicolor]|uniref:uncharacterized protein n=1 Tax=Aspergillus multicolor TaxID=41759 RepID=UPI003CCCEC07
MRFQLLTLALSLASMVKATVPPEYLQANHQKGDPPPFGAVDNVQTIRLSGQPDAVGETQPADCPTIMISTATPGGDHINGWTEIPTVAGFDLNRLVVDEDTNATLPYYVENTKDLTQIKRVVLTTAGIWRNGWKYANNIRNALICAAGRESVNADMSKILVAAPQWLNKEDVAMGAAQPDDIYYHKNTYQRGAPAVGPGDVRISSFEALDKLIAMFWDKDIYPALETIVFASHSLGAQTVQRYAMLRPSQPNDNLITYGIMNPGSFAWPIESRPVSPSTQPSCSDPSIYDAWHYGIGSGKPTRIPKYVRDEVLENRGFVQERYAFRHVFYGFGLEDHGKGDTHCEAQLQGATHLERGQNFMDALKELPGGYPENHSVEYVKGVSHLDYHMMVSEQMQRKMFLLD